ncbi:MAG: hypothetical protein ACRCTZ_05350 [Sarcina sp.]
MNYKVQFSQIEKNIFNTIERDSMRLSTMSVYSILINNADENGICNLSYKQIIARAKRKNKMVLSMLKRRIDLLSELGLIKVIVKKLSDVKQKYSYEIIRKIERFKVEKNENKNEKENEKKNESDAFERIEDTSFIKNNEVHNIKSKTKIYNNIYIKDFDIAKKIALELFKVFKVKKEIIKNTVLQRLQEVYQNINEKGAKRYITTMILNTILFFEKLSKQHNINLVTRNRKNKTARKQNFVGRTYDKEDYESMFDDPSSAFC